MATTTTYHDIEHDGMKFIMELRTDDDGNGYIGLTEACDPTPCDWFINKATVPSWCCATHQYDGTGDYPANAGIVLPETCMFSPVDEDGECITEHTTYDFFERSY